MVGELDSGASARGSIPGVLCSWARQFTLAASLSTQVYKYCDGLPSRRV